MPKIVVTQELNFTPDQEKRLRTFGDVKMYHDLPATYDDWVERVKSADIICSGKFGLEQRGHTLKNKFISLPYVSVSWYDHDKGQADNLVVANSPGSNKDAVADWIIAMVINLTRDLPAQINQQPYPKGQMPPPTPGLTGLKICLLGAGNIGTRVAAVCQALGMQVSFFRRGDDLTTATAGQDIIVNCLSSNPSTAGLLSQNFFSRLKPGAYFITVAIEDTLDTEAMLAALESGQLAGVATDCASVQVGNAYDPFFLRLAHHPKVLATPHIAYNTLLSAKVGVDMMIDNIEAWLAGKPQNIV